VFNALGFSIGGVLTVADGALGRLVAGAEASTPLVTLASAVVALGVLIFIHELGHFLVAKAVGVGVERFSLGFGPRLWSMRRGETEYCVSVVPLGGYVKMLGEEASGEDVIHPPVAPAADPAADRRSFAKKPLWARAVIVFAGPAMNFVLAAVIYSSIFVVVGVPVLPTVVGRLLPDSAAAQAGLHVQDRVVAIDGRAVRHWGEIEDRVARSGGHPLTLTVVRAAKSREVTVTPRKVPVTTPFGERSEAWSLGMTPYLPPVVGEVLPGKPAAEARLRPGDRIAARDGHPIETWDELADTISTRPGQPMTLTIERDGSRLDVEVTPAAETERDALGNERQVGRIGIARPSPTTMLRENPVAAVGLGLQRTWDVTALTAVSIWKLVSGVIPASNIGGPIQIGVVAGQAAQQGLTAYAIFVALISINLAILNLLPVPMLDGGHLLFFAIEAVLGRPLSLRKREIAQQIGLALLMLLMVFALFNDVSRFSFVGRMLK
jgi:regulator of sigma E protease